MRAIVVEVEVKFEADGSVVVVADVEIVDVISVDDDDIG